MLVWVLHDFAPSMNSTRAPLEGAVGSGRGGPASSPEGEHPLPEERSQLLRPCPDRPTLPTLPMLPTLPTLPTLPQTAAPSLRPASPIQGKAAQCGRSSGKGRAVRRRAGQGSAAQCSAAQRSKDWRGSHQQLLDAQEVAAPLASRSDRVQSPPRAHARGYLCCSTVEALPLGGARRCRPPSLPHALSLPGPDALGFLRRFLRCPL